MKINFNLLLLLSLFINFQASAQLNVEFVGQLDYDIGINDIWGYAAPDGSEYALLGLREGTAIISLADPSNPTEVAYVEGTPSTWRDIKTWDEYAYVTTGDGGDGITIIDLSNLPNSVSTTYKTNLGSFGNVGNCHNIYIDEFGYAYISGCGLNNGGVIILDCFTDPLNPTAVAEGPNIYAHDIYAQGNIMYTSDIYEGSFAMYDVSDKNNINFLARQITGGSFTHNTWASPDNTLLFTTDETGGAPVGAYDISDPNNIQTLDQFRPIETLGTNVVPHNVHVFENWLIVSYYTDGCIIVDATDPSNLIEVGNFDTYLGAGTGFSGAWGAYPFLPSGLILVSDRSDGLFVLAPTYVKACRLEGIVLDSITGLPITNASVEINTAQANLGVTDIAGAYQSGIATAGTYEVTFSALEYTSKTVQINLENDELTIQNIELTRKPEAPIIGQVISAEDGTPISGAVLEFSNALFDYTTNTEADGSFELPAVFLGEYETLIGKWGFHTKFENRSVESGFNNFVIELEQGYRDEFILDLGWTSSGTATSGQWVRDIPIGNTYQNILANVDFDLPNDLGEFCFFTGNNLGPSSGVQNGNAKLVSPVMDLTSFDNPVISFYAYFFNESWQPTVDETIIFSIDNGTEQIALKTIDGSTYGWTEPLYFPLNGLLEITKEMTLVVETYNEPQSAARLEAAIDLFEIYDVTGHPIFSSNETIGCLPFEVDFKDEGTDAISWNWTFEGGIPATSTEQNPTVIFNEVGYHSVNLIVAKPTGIASITQEAFIQVKEAPISNFTHEVTGTTVNFTNTSTGSGSYLWDFGDGNTSMEESPSHNFSLGNHTVTLISENECGLSQSVQQFSFLPSGLTTIDPSMINLTAMPNPFMDVVQVDFKLPDNQKESQLILYNLLGQQAWQRNILSNEGNIQLGENLEPGVYFLQLKIGAASSSPLRIIKQ